MFPLVGMCREKDRSKRDGLRAEGLKGGRHRVVEGFEGVGG